MGELTGKVALVTGAGGGIGHASALAFAAAGAAVLAADIDGERAAATAVSIRANGGAAAGWAVDVADEQQVQAMVAAAVAEFGGLDILHNNVADVRPEILGNDVGAAQIDTALWDHCLAVNLRGTMLGCKWAIPALLKRGGGAIVNTSSVGGQVGQEQNFAYGVSKSGVDGLTRYVATAYGKRGIRCNAVAPGFTLTAAARALPEPLQQVFLNNVLTPYLGEPEDIAAVAVFLCTPAARYVTGQIIAVDGGETAHAANYADLRRLRGEV